MEPNNVEFILWTSHSQIEPHIMHLTMLTLTVMHLECERAYCRTPVEAGRR